jgi:hypothetical protein
MAQAFAHAFWWATAFTGIAAVAAILLTAQAMRTSRRSADEHGNAVARSSLHEPPVPVQASTTATSESQHVAALGARERSESYVG